MAQYWAFETDFDFVGLLRMIDLKDNMILKTTEEIKAVSDPYRLKILRVLSSYEEGATASMVAEEMEVVKIPFLMTYDKRYPGEKPLRTYSGPRYVGGVSDHCAVTIKIY